eukprot:scaffold4632_cov110-Isochrysis_galbana.AAC.2
MYKATATTSSKREKSSSAEWLSPSAKTIPQQKESADRGTPAITAETASESLCNPTPAAQRARPSPSTAAAPRSPRPSRPWEAVMYTASRSGVRARQSRRSTRPPRHSTSRHSARSGMYAALTNADLLGASSRGGGETPRPLHCRNSSISERSAKLVSSSLEGSRSPVVGLMADRLSHRCASEAGRRRDERTRRGGASDQAGCGPLRDRRGMRVHLQGEPLVRVPVRGDDWVVEHLLCDRADGGRKQHRTSSDYEGGRGPGKRHSLDATGCSHR